VDISYSMAVTNPSSLTIWFISFNSATRVVEWTTSDYAQVGTYTITITGKIQAASAFEASLSFTLTVTASCAQSNEGN
jgi:hypothetical protein